MIFIDHDKLGLIEMAQDYLTERSQMALGSNLSIEWIIVWFII